MSTSQKLYVFDAALLLAICGLLAVGYSRLAIMSSIVGIGWVFLRFFVQEQIEQQQRKEDLRRIDAEQQRLHRERERQEEAERQEKQRRQEHLWREREEIRQVKEMKKQRSEQQFEAMLEEHRITMTRLGLSDEEIESELESIRSEVKA